jgi:SET domain-containing protein
VRKIRKGTRIVEYRGERLSSADVDRRYERRVRGPDHTFLFLVRRGVYVDASRRGNDARFINHSCEPSCEAVLDDGRVFIEAIRDIAVGEELTYDYALDPDDRPRRSWKSAYPCRCGSRRCRKTTVDAKLVSSTARGARGRVTRSPSVRGRSRRS